MSEVINSKIICNLRKAHPLIEKIEAKNIREYMKEYITKNSKIKKLKLKFNKRLLIKSLISNIENNKTNIFFRKSEPFNNKQKHIIFQNDSNNGILNNKKLLDNNNIKIKKCLSYNNLNEAKEPLNNNDIYNIKSNKKFINNNFDIINKDKNEIKDNRLILSENNYRKINTNEFLHSSLKNNNNIHNIVLMSSKRSSSSQSHNEKYKNISNNNFSEKSNKSIQSYLNLTSSINKNKKIKKNNSDGFFFNFKIDRKVNQGLALNRINKFRKINKVSFEKKNPKKEYLRFLEKKCLALRANFIMNNIQNSRGGKQELRALYNPLNV